MEDEETLAIQSIPGFEIIDCLFVQTNEARGKTSWWPIQDWDCVRTCLPV